MSREKVKEFEFKTDDYHLVSYFTSMGHRVGYLGMPKKKFKRVLKPDGIHVHGGPTYEGPLEGSDLEYIGFDCAHYQDAVDEETMKKLFPEIYDQYLNIGMFNYRSGTVKDLDFVVREIFCMLKQVQSHTVPEGYEPLLTYCKQAGSWDFYYRWIVRGSLSDDEVLFLKLNNLDYY